jgi:serine phosphatase RsbU (regulator of sigma subunit)
VTEANGERAVLDDADRRSRQLEEVTLALAADLTTGAVGDTIVSVFKDLFGAAYATVMLLADDGRTVRFLRLQAVPNEVARLMAEIPRGSRSATTDALSRREPIFHPDLSCYLSDYPHLEAATRALGVQGLAHLPLLGGDRTLGVLSISWVDPQSFSTGDRRLFSTVAELCAIAIRRAELFEQKSEMTSMLQRAILPRRLPNYGDIQLAARYLPAEAELEVGGDWYDAFEGPDGSLWMSVGDIGGHGVQAAAAMAELRSSVRAAAFAGLGPAGCLDVLDGLLTASSDGQVATAIVVRFEPEAGQLTWSSSGHLPPVLRERTGPVRLLDDQLGPMLGLGLTGRQYSTVAFPPGTTLVLYTDGLVENRGEDLDVGLRRLAEAVADPGRPPRSPGEVADATLAASLAGGQRQDDLCVLVAVHQAA